MIHRQMFSVVPLVKSTFNSNSNAPLETPLLMMNPTTKHAPHAHDHPSAFEANAAETPMNEGREG